MLNVIEGENTLASAGGRAGRGRHSGRRHHRRGPQRCGSQRARTLWKEITVTGLPPRPAYVQTSIVGSLTVDLDEEFAVYVPEDDQVATYAWSVPEALTVVSGGDTERVVLKANRKSVNIPANSISVTTVSRTGLSETHRFEKMICVLPTDGYPAKRYGTKTWMTVNLNYAGEDGSVGRTAPDDPDGSKYGRYYTWAEAMTGLSAGENPYVYGASGTDDMGNSYTLNNGVASYNIQVRGICPEGWHVPNAYDFYDLAAGRRRRLRASHEFHSGRSGCGAGIYMPDNRETNPMAAMNMVDHGFIASYLRGSRPAAEGGLWAANANAVDGGTMFNIVRSFPALRPLPTPAATANGFAWASGSSWTHTGRRKAKRRSRFDC